MRNALIFGLILTSPVLGQAPRIAIVQPAGGQAGTTFPVAVTGLNLDDVETLHFSVPGVKVESLGVEKLSDESMKKGGGMTAPAARATAKFQVTLPSGLSTGIHDVRVVAKGGISNPRAFHVSDRPEIAEKEPNDDAPVAMKIPLGTTINGVIDKGVDVDFFQFAGKKGERVVVRCLSTSIESKLPATIELFTASGRPLASNRFSQNYDAALVQTLPDDGDYLIRISSFTYTQGGPDFFYRLVVGTMPMIEAVIPPMVEPGKEAKVEVLGHNLPGGVFDKSLGAERLHVSVKVPSDPLAVQRLSSQTLLLPPMAALDGFDLRLTNPGGASEPVFVGLTRSPVAVETEPNDVAAKANPIPMPIQISGRIERRGDVDWYSFTATKDQPLAIDLFADRLRPSPLGSSIDLRYTLLGPNGNIVTTQDEMTETASNQFFTRTDDPARYVLTPKETGEYRIGVSASDSQFGMRYVYSLRIAPEDSDFRVIAMPLSTLSPDSAVVGTEGNYAFTMYVQRLGSFVGDVTIAGKKLPPGVSVPPQVISGSQKQAVIAVMVSKDTPPFAGPIELSATGVIDGKEVVREVRSATITHPVAQAGPTLLSRLDRELMFAVRERAKYSVVPSTTSITVPQGEKISLGLKLQPLSPEFKSSVQVSLPSPPPGLVLGPTTLTADKEASITFDSKGPVAPGKYTLVLRGQTQPATGKPPVKGAPANSVEHAPPIAITVVPRQLLKLTPPAAPVKISRGGEGTVVVAISKLYPVEGPIEIEIPTLKGIEAMSQKVAANENEAKLTIRIANDAPLGPALVTIRATARSGGLAIPHEAKVPLAIVK